MTDNQAKVKNDDQVNKELPFKSRPPVVVVLGHVDHGKTKLLDTIRKSNISGEESGGITQHIGAYQVEVSSGSGSKKLITFLDTPGHEAFTAIRSRGAKVADIAILVVAADESVKPQTKEAIRIIREEKITVAVAINKIDKEGASVHKVKQDLAAEEILVEEWGGKVPAIEVSAKTGHGINELLEIILLLAELEELKEDLSRPTQGVIIESHLDKRRGYAATALIQKGIIGLGDWAVVGTVLGKVKSMENFVGQSILKAYPSQPVLITGWPSAPDIGRILVTADSKDEATRLAEENVDLTPLLLFMKGAKEDVNENQNKKYLNLVLKSDVSSSLEAIESILKAIKSEEVEYNIISYDIGNIIEADVKTAIASRGQVVGFRVATEESAKNLADRENIKLSSFEIIYELVEYIRKEMVDLLEPEIKRNLLGKLKVLAIFKKDSKSQIVGGKVVSGKVIRGAFIDVIRNSNKISSGRLGQLQSNKIDMPEVKEGLEAGVRFDQIPSQPFEDVKEGDILEAYEEEKVIRNL